MMLEQEIEKYLSGQTLCNCDSVSYRNIKNLILGFAEPREKQIQALGERCLQLQKDKGNLTDKVRDLEQENEQIKNSDTLCKLIGKQKRKITELEAQIEKMKCCENCGWYYLQQHWRENKEINESRMFHCGTCGNKRNWKLGR